VSKEKVLWEQTRSLINMAIRMRYIPSMVLEIEGVSKDSCEKFQLIFSIGVMMEKGLLNFDCYSPKTIFIKNDDFEISYEEYSKWVKEENKRLESIIINS
jgi:hypothetical protein